MIKQTSTAQLKSTHSYEINKFKEWLIQKRYSKNTIKIYTHMLNIFFSYYTDKAITGISNSNIIQFNYDFVIKRKYSNSFQNQMLSAIKLFYTKNHEVSLHINEIERPIRKRSLPKVIPKEDIRVMLECMPNLKHKLALSMIYGLGLRRGELLNLRLRDIDSKRMLVYILNAKGNKDRSLPLSRNLLLLCRKYYIQYRPQYWLIEGCKRDKPIRLPVYKTSLNDPFQISKKTIHLHYIV